MDPDLVPSALLAAALVATNAYFIIAELALLTLHRGRITPLARAHRILGASLEPEELLFTAQLGRGLSTLLLGYLAAGPVATLVLGHVLRGVDAAAAFLTVVALVHTVLSQAAKQVGVHLAGRSVGWTVLVPLRLITLLLRPLVWALLRVVRAAIGGLGVSAAGLHPFTPTPEEIRHLVTHGHADGVVEMEEREMIHGVFEFSETVAREVMTPRIDIVAVPVDIELGALIDLIAREGHSRLPVYEGTIDSIVGVLLAKDLLPLLARPGAQGRDFDVRAVMRQPYFVPDSKPVDDLLAEFRLQKVHLAVVLDEFGGTYGLVTMEDLLEEIVGEINDEYDVAEPEFAATPEGDVLIDGGALISEVNERFGLTLPEEDYDTIGGFVFGALGRIPEPGDEVTGSGRGGVVVLQVDETEDRRVTRVRLSRGAPVPEPVPDDQPGAVGS